MAQQQHPEAKAGAHKADQNKAVIPPTHVVIDPPFPAVPNAQGQPNNAQAQSPDEPLPRFLRPEWVIVYITAVYVFFTGLTLLTIRRQANTMDRQAKDALISAQSTLNEIKRQADLMDAQLAAMKEASEQVNRQIGILERSVAAAEKSATAAKDNIALYVSKERARLRVDAAPLELRRDDVIIGSVNYSIKHFGHTDAILTDVHVFAFLTDSTDIPPDSETKDVWGFGPDPQVIKPSQAPIESSTPVETRLDFDLTQETAALQEGERFIHFWGWIGYKDVFGETRTTKFRYVWKRRQFQSSSQYHVTGDWEKCGPPEDNSET